MTWARPDWLWSLPLVALLAAILVAAAWRHRQRWGRRVSAEIEKRILPPSVRVRRAVRDALLLGGLVLIVIALAEPRFGKVVRTVRSTGTDLVLLVDLSRSMDAQDVDPSRLERARREIVDLGEVIEGDRVGLVFFAGGAYPRMPLTADYKAIETVVREADTSSFQTQGSDLGAAIRVGVELLSRSTTESGRALVVLSDGEAHDPKEALAAAAGAAQAGIPIFGMGIGVEPAPIPLSDGRFLEWRNETAITTPDFTVLEQVARDTGGAFVRSHASVDDMRSLYAEIRATVRAVERDEREHETWRSTFQWPLAAALLAMLIGSWLGDGRRRYGAAAAILLALSLGPSGPAWAADLHEADRLYREGKFERAVDLLTELSLEHPDDASLQERLGAARYRAGDAEGAARAFEYAARLRGGDDPDALYNGGNAAYEAGRLEKALELYDRALGADPEHAAAKQNRDAVQKEIEARRAVPPPPPPQPQQQDQQQEQQPDREQQGEQEPQGEQEQEGQAEQGGDDDQEPEGEQEREEGGPGGEDVPTEAMTEGQARQLLDSVEEGEPRTVTFGSPERKPW